MKTLYLCYFGLREPLVQTQVLPYLRCISEDGVEVHLLTFEPNRRNRWSQGEVKNWRARLQANGVCWHSLPYHKWPSVPATLYDVLAGAWVAWRLVRRYRIDVVHARSHVPMAMALMVQRLTCCRVIFDFRGLLADEYAAAGVWREGSLAFQAVKQLERIGLQRADRVVVLTERMRTWLIERELISPARIAVIPCCVDTARVACEPHEMPQETSDQSPHQSRSRRDGAGCSPHWRTGSTTGRVRGAPFEVIYAGSVTGLYLLEDMGRFVMALHAKQPNVLFRILTQVSPAYVKVTLEKIGLRDSDFWVGAVGPEEVPAYLKRARLGLSFRRPTFAQMAACPTKIPEYLAAGLPVVCNAGVGDMDDVLECRGVGVIIRTTDPEGFGTVVERVLKLVNDSTVRGRCQNVAREYFDLERVGAARYQDLYRSLRDGAASESSAGFSRAAGVVHSH